MKLTNCDLGFTWNQYAVAILRSVWINAANLVPRADGLKILVGSRLEVAFLRVPLRGVVNKEAPVVILVRHIIHNRVDIRGCFCGCGRPIGRASWLEMQRRLKANQMRLVFVYRPVDP